MAKRLAGVGAAIALLALVFSMVVPAMADRRYERVTLRLAEKFADDEQTNINVDVGPQGDSAGDYFVIGGDPVFNRARTERLGETTGNCLLVGFNSAEGAGTFECDVTITLAGGSITVEGPFSFTDEGFVSPSPDQAVTGGTGRFKAAHGELEISFDEQGLLFTLRLLL